MRFFGRIIGWFRQRAERRNTACRSMLDEVVQAIEELDSFFRTGEFLDPRDSRALYEKQNELRAVLAFAIALEFTLEQTEGLLNVRALRYRTAGKPM